MSENMNEETCTKQIYILVETLKKALHPPRGGLLNDCAFFHSVLIRLF